MKPTPMSGLSEVAGLAVIAGQHAKAAGVNRQRLVQRELRGEVGDRLLMCGMVFLQVLCGPRGVERRHGASHLEERGVSHRSVELVARIIRTIFSGLWAVARLIRNRDSGTRARVDASSTRDPWRVSGRPIRGGRKPGCCLGRVGCAAERQIS
jgi:hypothetical protein